MRNNRFVIGVGVALLFMLLNTGSSFGGPVPVGGRSVSPTSDVDKGSETVKTGTVWILQKWCEDIAGCDKGLESHPLFFFYERCEEAANNVTMVIGNALDVKIFNKAECLKKPWVGPPAQFGSGEVNSSSAEDKIDDSEESKEIVDPLVDTRNITADNDWVHGSNITDDKSPEKKAKEHNNGQESGVEYVVQVVLAILTVLVVSVCIFGIYLGIRTRWAVSQFYPVTGGVIVGESASGTGVSGIDTTDKSKSK